MGRMYTVEGGPTAVTTAVDFLEIAPADDKICIVHAVFVTQKTEIGDAQEEFIEILMQRGGTAMTSGSGGAAPTPRPMQPSDTAAGFTSEVFNTTRATFTAGVNIHRETFNERVGFAYVPTPEMRPYVTQANGGLTVGTADVVADSVTLTVTAYIEEIG